MFGYSRDELVGKEVEILVPKRIEVYIFESLDLPDHWSRLDEFEGLGYRRVVVTQVSTADGELR
jgi:hypothetical protein